MRNSQQNSIKLGMLSLLAIPLVSLFGAASASAAVADAIDMPSAQDGKITLDAGKEYKGNGFTIPADTTIEGNGATVYGNVVVGGDNVTIDHVNFVDDGDGDSRAITADSTAKNLSISSNTFKGYSGATISLGAGDYSGLSIAGNTDDNKNANNVQVVLNTAVDGIDVTNNNLSNTIRIEGFADSPTTGVVISGNTINNLQPNNSAISLVKADGALVDGNTVTTAGNYNSAILSFGQLTNSTISNNTVTGSGPGSSAAISISNDDYAGKKVDPSSGLTISGNTITDVDRGMFITYASDVKLDDNNISDVSYGLLLGSKDTHSLGSLNITKGNVISGNTEAIHLNGGPSSLADGATISISKEAKLTGAVSVGDATDMVTYYDEPVVDEPTVDDPTTDEQPTTPEVPEVTPPVSTTDGDNEGDIAAPNTGNRIGTIATSAVAFLAMVASSVVVLRRLNKSLDK